MCEPDWYNDGEYCDCNCGVYDPDCGLPSKSNAADPDNGFPIADHPAYVLFRFNFIKCDEM